MTRRLIVTMVGVVAAALAVASIGTLLIARLEARTQARRDLGAEAARLAARVESVQAPGALQVVARALRLEGASLLRLGPDGRLRGELPGGLDTTDIDVARLRAGQVATGVVDGGLAFAAAPAATRPARGEAGMVLVLTRQLDVGRRPLGPWFLLAVAATLAVAGVVAANLARRLTRPLQEAEQATRRIAAGDLAVRVPEDPSDGPELAGLAASINTMAASLERSRGLERQFLMSVSHELRTPLTSIRGFGEALAEGRAPDPAQAGSIVTAEARRLERLVGDLLELAKLGAQRFSLDVRPTDVAEVVTDTAEGFRPAAEREGISLEVSVGGDAGAGTAVTAQADPDRLAQVVANLVENALEFASDRVSVTVAEVGGPAGGAVGVAVEDDGPGIPAEDLPHVFEPFYRSDRVASRRLGSGLGLAIVAELAAAMGGSVQAENAAGGGTRVVVALRRSPSPAPGGGGWQRGPAQPGGSVAPGSPVPPSGGAWTQGGTPKE